jgi:heme-degrading monooxygenase HmoA
MKRASSNIATTPEPPYYAVIFTSKRSDGDHGYSQMADRMVDLAKTMPGYLGMESVRSADGVGITVSYWRSEDDIGRWKQNAEHLRAQEGGKQIWYEAFAIRVARVERAYGRQREQLPFGK